MATKPSLMLSLLALFPLFATSCVGVASTDPATGYDLPTSFSIDSTVYHCSVDATSPGRVVPPGIFGANLEWTNRANGLSDTSGSPDATLTAYLSGAPVDGLRFPGGTFSDYYDWTHGRGPIASRPTMAHATDTGSEVNVFGSAEYLSLCESLGLRPFLTVNVGTGDSILASSWVSYCNDPSNTLRQADGLGSGPRVDWWEIGNEAYYPDNPGTPALSFTAATYAAKAGTIIDAMRGIDSTIKILAIGTMNPYAVALPNPGWTETVLASLSGKIDGLAVHQAYFPVSFGSASPSAQEAYGILWAGPDYLATSLEATASLLDAAEATAPARSLSLALTEWGPLFPLDNPTWADHMKTMGSALFVARALQVLAQARRLELAHFFKFSDTILGMGFVDYRKDTKISWEVFKLYRELALSRVLPSSIVSGPTYTVAESATLGSSTALPALTSLACLSADGTVLRVNLVNRSWDTIRKVRIDLTGFSALSCTRKTLSTASVLDHNGSDISAEISASNYTDPPTSADFAGLRAPVVTEVAPGSVLELAPFSVTTLEFRK